MQGTDEGPTPRDYDEHGAHGDGYAPHGEEGEGSMHLGPYGGHDGGDSGMHSGLGGHEDGGMDMSGLGMGMGMGSMDEDMPMPNRLQEMLSARSRSASSRTSRPASAVMDLRGSRPNSAAIAQEIEGFEDDFMVGDCGPDLWLVCACTVH